MIRLLTLNLSSLNESTLEKGIIYVLFKKYIYRGLKVMSLFINFKKKKSKSYKKSNGLFNNLPEKCYKSFRHFSK